MVYMKNPESSLPPGFRFHPTDEELILHYLKKKLTSTPFPLSIIADVDIYKFDPWDLPDKAAFGEKEWYFFSPRDRKCPNGARPNRAAASGYWKATGTDKIILATTTTGGGVGVQENIGVKKALVFYKGRPPKGIKTNWIMHEYRLAGNPNNLNRPVKPKDSSMRLDDWVLCRIYRKFHVSSPTSNAIASDQDQEEEEEQFVQETLLPILRSSPAPTLNPQKSSSFSNLLDAMDYSLLSNFLSDNQIYQTGFESAPMNTTTPGNLDKMNKRPSKHESLSDKIHRFRSVLLVVSIPLLLIVFVLFLMPGRSSSSDPVSLTNRRVWPNQKLQKSYAVIFDAGSSGSRVHVYCFDQNLDLVPIGKDLELFVQVKPGLSAYASDPQQAAESLVSLLDRAQGVVPHDLRPKTPVRVGATAGLRALGHDVSERILQEVRDLLKYKSTFKTEQNGVTVLDGIQEGAYEWVTINYLLGKLGKKYSNTVGVVDLGGGSVQMAYAISEEDAAKAPEVPEGEDSYVKEMLLMGTKYFLYVHSYLHYGLLAARAEMLMVTEDSDNPCILAGYDGLYKYGGKDHKASAPSSGSNLDQCVSVALKALKVNDTCSHMQCTFGGIWNGGRGDGQKHLFVASFFFDRAAEAGFIDPKKPVAKVSPADFEVAAKRACQTNIKDAKLAFPHVDDSNLPYICMDLVYQHTLLVVGFGLEPWQEITLVKQVEYQNSPVEAAWPLGSAIEAVSST